MTLKDIQASISQWGQDTFGASAPDAIAARMNVEVAELLNGFTARNRTAPGSQERQGQDFDLGLECADVLIMLVQVADALGVDLEFYVQFKMNVNRKRDWGRTKLGKVQHIEPEPVAAQPAPKAVPVKKPKAPALKPAPMPAPVAETAQPAILPEPVTAILPEPVTAEPELEPSSPMVARDRWFIFRRDMTPVGPSGGFADSGSALRWAQGADGRRAGIEEVELPSYDPDDRTWADRGDVNVLFGGDLNDFYEVGVEA